MSYALIRNGAVVTYPYTFAMLRADNPQVSYSADTSPAKLAEYGVVEIAETPRPPSTTTQDFVEATPTLVSGVWTQRWVAQAVPAEEATRRQQEATSEAERLTVKADAFVQQFIAMTPQQVTDYVNTNVTDLASARALLRRISLMLLLLARREFR